MQLCEGNISHPWIFPFGTGGVCLVCSNSKGNYPASRLADFRFEHERKPVAIFAVIKHKPAGSRPAVAFRPQLDTDVFQSGPGLNCKIVPPSQLFGIMVPDRPANANWLSA